MVSHAPIPADEAARVTALRSYGILDTPADERFDLFTRLATWLFHVPVCAINLVDEERTFFKSLIGFQAYEPRRCTSICAHAVGLGEPIMEVEDLAADPRFHDHPLYLKRGLRFYAGALLRSDNGQAIGTICIGDVRPRILSHEDRLKLTALANGIGAMLELHRYGVRMLEAATRDALTGLYNRRHFEEELEGAVARAKSGIPCALMYIDLDRFKQVNDTMGHAAGDALLREVARRMSATARHRDIVARLAGDEFVLLMGGPADAAAAADLAERMLAAFAEPFELDGQILPLRSSIGIALCPGHATSAASLLHCADLALYEAKHNGRNCFSLGRAPAEFEKCAA